MLGSHPCVSAQWALPTRLGQAGRSSSSSSVTDQQLRSLITNAVQQLPFEHRDVIYRAYYQRWTIAKIADDLKLTEAAVKSRLHDGLHRLRLTLRRADLQRYDGVFSLSAVPSGCVTGH